MDSAVFIRRIDDLGRIVIPKEMRRAERIQEGDAFQVTSTEHGIILTKYSEINTLELFAKKYADVLFDTSLIPILICSLDRVIAASGISDRLVFKCRISSDAEIYIRNRKAFILGIHSTESIKPLEDLDYKASIIYPVTSISEVVGAVIMLETDNVKNPSEAAIKLAQSAASFLSKMLED